MPGSAKIFSEYLYAVEYHLSLAEKHADRILPNFSDLQLTVISGKIRLLQFDPQTCIENGDIAIRETASAIEVALLLTRYILKSGVKRNNQNILRDMIVEMSGMPSRQGLVKVLRQLNNSHLFGLLNEYRHWVTHRGAPICRYKDEEFAIPQIAMPDDAPQSFVEHRLKAEIGMMLRTRVSIICVPFVPNVGGILNGKIENIPNDTRLKGGIVMSKGSSATFVGVRTGTGSLFLTKEEYDKLNAMPLHNKYGSVAEETLVKYELSDYHIAIHRIRSHTERLLAEDWDQQLAEACKASN